MTDATRLTKAVPVLILSLLVLFLGGAAISAEEDVADLQNLHFIADGEYEGQDAAFEYWFRDIGTDKECFRMLTVTNDDDQEVLEWIVKKESEEAYYRDRDTTGWNWQPVPYMESLYARMSEPILDAEGAEFWRSIEGEEEYMVMEVGEDQEEEKVRIYEVKVDEPIEDSVFDPYSG
ncbi:hypothetical protein KGY72_04800 [Candidatus Bipolaricaulota bacterium]|nr:hypothetical protein [Candidatus Bipolaricaulota bacterium]MBS3792012.1 hypothetical protein [Candidatus Bipolaricaulota bacterium]